jgi:ATP-binding cassette subfamily B protein
VGSVRPPAAGARTVALAWEAIRLVAAANRRGFAVAVALQVAGAVAVTVVVVAGKLALDVIVTPDAPAAQLAGPLVLLAAATALSTATAGVQAQQQRLLGEDAVTRAWSRLLRVTGRTPLRTHDSPDFHERVERLEVNALSRPAAIATAALGVLGSALSVTFLAAAVYVLEPLLLPTLLVAGLPTLLLSRRAGATEFSFVRTWTGTYRRRFYVRELLTQRQSAQEVRAFQAQAELERRHDALSAAYRRGLAGQVRKRQLLALAIAASSALLLGATLVIIVALLRAGRLTLPEAGAAVIAVRLLSGQLDRFFAALGTIVEAGAFLRDLDDFVATTPVEPTATAPRPLQHALEVRGVRFRYPDQGTDALAGVDLDVRRGEVVALVGENGSGKTTLAKIVAGLYQPSEGAVRWDGRPVEADDLGSVRQATAVMFQDFVRYELTAAENVLLAAGQDEQAHARAADAVRRAGVLEALAELPQGIDTQLGRMFEGGVDLSGGQWQRLALARALARDSSLVVLDEPSSSLDPAAEHRLFSDIRALVRDRACVLVSHRYANLHLADRVYVLAEGRVVESGTHAELMARGGVYAELYRLQAGAFQLT